MKVLLTHTPDFCRQYYGERAPNGLQALVEVKLHEVDDALDANDLVYVGAVNGEHWTRRPKAAP